MLKGDAETRQVPVIMMTAKGEEANVVAGYRARRRLRAVTDRAVDVQIVGLRKKLGPCGDYIETVRGVGYRFKDG
jgi:DNA-binding response OmpR family regulator